MTQQNNNFLKPILIDIDKSDIILTIGVDDMVYKTDVNSFVANTGMTVKNVSFPITGYYIALADISKTFSCGNVLENLFLEFKRNDLDNALLVLDFEDVEEVAENFYATYTKILLETSNKIITINMNTQISNEFGSFIKESIKDVEE